MACRCKGKGSSSNWSALPDDLLQGVAAELSQAGHRRRMAMVCRTWAAAAAVTSLDVVLHRGLALPELASRLETLVRRHPQLTSLHFRCADGDAAYQMELVGPFEVAAAAAARLPQLKAFLYEGPYGNCRAGLAALQTADLQELGMQSYWGDFSCVDQAMLELSLAQQQRQQEQQPVTESSAVVGEGSRRAPSIDCGTGPAFSYPPPADPDVRAAQRAVIHGNLAPLRRLTLWSTVDSLLAMITHPTQLTSLSFRLKAQPQLQGGFFAAIAHLTALRELSVGNWMPDREGPGKADDVCLAPLSALSQLSVMRLSMLHGSAAASLPPMPTLRDLSLTFIGSSAVPDAALGRIGQYRGLTRLALEGCPRLGEQAGTSQTLLHALSTMLQLRRLSLSLCVALPPPPGARVASCGGKAAAGPQLEALDLWQVSFPDKGDDGRTLKAWLGALAPALAYLRELGLEDCSMSPARWTDLAALVPLGRLTMLRGVQYLPHYLPRDPGLPVALSPPACLQQCGGGGYRCSSGGLSGTLRELRLVLDRHQWLDGRALAALTGLQALSVSETLSKGQSQLPAALPALARLTRLSYSRGFPSGRGWERDLLAATDALPALRSLHLASVPDRGADAAALSLAALPPLPSLEEVRVDARVVVGTGLAKLLQQQARLALLSVTELVAGSPSARADFVRLVPPHLDLAVGVWAVADQNHPSGRH